MGLLDTKKKEVPMHNLLFSGAGDVQSTIVGFIKSKKDKYEKMSQRFRQRGYDETLIDHLSYTYDSIVTFVTILHCIKAGQTNKSISIGHF